MKSSVFLGRWPMVGSQRSKDRLVIQLLWLLLLAVVSLPVFIVVELPLLLGQDAEWSARIEPYEWLLHLHAVAGVAAMTTGAFQLVSVVRDNYPRLHRRLGYVYLACTVIAAPVAIWIAVRYIDPAEGLALATQGVLWLFTTVAALLAIRARDVPTHRLWMARSYALTLTFVLVRFTTSVLGLQLPEEAGGAAAMIWLSTILVVLAADSIVALRF